MFKFFYFHIYLVAMFWLNLPLDDHHFGYIIKWTKKILLGEILPIKKEATSRGFLFQFCHGSGWAINHPQEE
jgi:hypothetical protein